MSGLSSSDKKNLKRKYGIIILKRIIFYHYIITYYGTYLSVFSVTHTSIYIFVPNSFVIVLLFY